MLSTIRHRAVVLSFLLISTVVFGVLGIACSDDPEPGSQDLGDVSNVDRGPRDLPTSNSENTLSSDTILPWPDQLVKYDTAQWPCVPEAEGMCDGDKNLFCQSGLCTQCPADYKDCNRTGDCECFGGCKDDKCAVKQ